jgi:hypothetical protein
MNDSKFYQISTDLGKTISFENKSFILAYTIIQEREHECGGSIISLLFILIFFFI